MFQVPGFICRLSSLKQAGTTDATELCGNLGEEILSPFGQALKVQPRIPQDVSPGIVNKEVIILHFSID